MSRSRIRSSSNDREWLPVKVRLLVRLIGSFGTVVVDGPINLDCIGWSRNSSVSGESSSLSGDSVVVVVVIVVDSAVVFGTGVIVSVSIFVVAVNVSDFFVVSNFVVVVVSTFVVVNGRLDQLIGQSLLVILESGFIKNTDGVVGDHIMSYLGTSVVVVGRVRMNSSWITVFQ